MVLNLETRYGIPPADITGPVHLVPDGKVEMRDIGLIARNFGISWLDSNMIQLTTSIGDIKIELYGDMPITTGNFKNLVQQGVYDGTVFHRVIDGFVIQGGDPTGTGSGDTSIPPIPDEFTDHNRNDRGTIAMANRGPNTGSSQFFINLVDNNRLDDKHPVFGRVVEGMSVVDRIGKVETDENDRPLQDVVVIRAELLPYS